MHVVGKLAGDTGLELAGPGLMDTTRLASSPPEIWRDIAASNEDVLREALDHSSRTLTDSCAIVARRRGENRISVYERVALARDAVRARGEQ